MKNLYIDKEPFVITIAPNLVKNVESSILKTKNKKKKVIINNKNDDVLMPALKIPIIIEKHPFINIPQRQYILRSVINCEKGLWSFSFR